MPWNPRWIPVTLGWLLSLGCTLHETYPPALPAPRVNWDNSPLVPVSLPPPELRYQPPIRSGAQALLPERDDWGSWQAPARAIKTCTGKGKRRRCTLQRPTAVDQANVEAIVKPTRVHTAYGQRIQVRYPYDVLMEKVYEIQCSPQEFTKLLLPPDQILSAKLTLAPADWEVLYGKSTSEGAYQQIVSVRPKEAGVKGRDVLVLQSGLTFYLQFLSSERLGMLSVTWDMPAPQLDPHDVPLDQRPPVFRSQDAYSGYAITVESKKKVAPPWLPAAVIDDGRNTLVKFSTNFEGQRLPVVSGLQQNGTPALVQSRLFVHKDDPEQGSWLYIQGLWPALRLKDAAGLQVKAVRQPPTAAKAVKEVNRAY
jgi:type IV secretory pathway VirB9-like protein